MSKIKTRANHYTTKLISTQTMHLYVLDLADRLPPENSGLLQPGEAAAGGRGVRKKEEVGSGVRNERCEERSELPGVFRSVFVASLLVQTLVFRS